MARKSVVLGRAHQVKTFGLAGTGTMQGVTETLADPALYDDREGYQEDFLGNGNGKGKGKALRVPLPELPSKADPASVQGGGIELKYHNFSVYQCKSRRLCYFSACNLRGSRTKPSLKRSNMWHYDPRVDAEFQLLRECYGRVDDGMFSRGHMTRREDPVWGPNKVTAEADTFHATNAVPQMQGHNSPVWLGLENHVLKNANKDDQRVTVITGPVLDPGDPEIYDVKVPVLLWKIVAFVHPSTGALAAAAYLDSQAAYLPGAAPAYVWGPYKGMQVPVARITKLTGLKFPKLGDADVLRQAGVDFSLAVHTVQDVLLS